MSTDDRREFIKKRKRVETLKNNFTSNDQIEDEIIDNNNSSKVEEDEFGRMSSEEKACAHTVAYTTFKKIDADGSGDVSPVEFARWYFMQGPNAGWGDGDEEVTKEKYNQYLLRIGIPFLAFGFMDNGLMIVCGDLIDSHITHGLGFSVMFSAAAGNIIADVSGVGFGDAVERWLSKLGLKDPQLTTQQLQHQKIRRGRTIASLVGISCGCVLGMLPLLLI